MGNHYDYWDDINAKRAEHAMNTPSVPQDEVAVEQRHRDAVTTYWVRKGMRREVAKELIANRKSGDDLLQLLARFEASLPKPSDAPESNLQKMQNAPPSDAGVRENNLDRCEICGAPPGKDCRTIQGRIDNHITRKPLSAPPLSGEDVEKVARALFIQDGYHATSWDIQPEAVGPWKRHVSRQDFETYCDKARAALATLSKPGERKGEWRDISTAPRDGSYILVCQLGQSEPSVTVVCFDDEWGQDGWWLCCDGKNPEIPLRGPEPTHWMPYPTPPAAAIREGRE